ncbi:hypothetical protein [Actinomadura rugatobispora]|uniref:Secreted protein n=1 Tax=Actinomadura rugatobispora TaxID=1994 RepID=A0ABW1AGZ5_9ACTN
MSIVEGLDLFVRLAFVVVIRDVGQERSRRVDAAVGHIKDVEGERQRCPGHQRRLCRRTSAQPLQGPVECGRIGLRRAMGIV